MGYFLLGVLVGMAIEEVCRYGVRKCDRFIKRMEDLPDVIDPPHPSEPKYNNEWMYRDNKETENLKEK